MIPTRTGEDKDKNQSEGIGSFKQLNIPCHSNPPEMCRIKNAEEFEPQTSGNEFLSQSFPDQSLSMKEKLEEMYNSLCEDSGGRMNLEKGMSVIKSLLKHQTLNYVNFLKNFNYNSYSLQTSFDGVMTEIVRQDLIYEIDTKEKLCYIIIKETTYIEEGSTSVYYLTSNKIVNKKLVNCYKLIVTNHFNGEGFQEYPILLEVNSENDFSESVENGKEREVFEVLDLEYIQDMASETEEKTALVNVISLVHNKKTLGNEVESEVKKVMEHMENFSFGNKHKDLLTVESMMLTNQEDDQSEDNVIYPEARALIEKLLVKIDLLQKDITPKSREVATGNAVSIDENGSSADKYSGIVSKEGNKTKRKKSSAISEREAALEVFRKFLNARWDAEEQKERNYLKKTRHDLKRKRDDLKRKRDDLKRKSDDLKGKHDDQKKKHAEMRCRDFDEDIVKKLNEDSSKLPKRSRKENCG